MSPINYFVSGAVAAEYYVAALFFFRYAAKMGDRLFSAFGGAFLLFAFEKVLSLAFSDYTDYTPAVYLVRLVGFVVIIAAILRKNGGAADRSEGNSIGAE